MDATKRSAIASLGGKAAHKHGAHEWNTFTAKEAGRTGGLRSAESKRRAKQQQETADGLAEARTD